MDLPGLSGNYRPRPALRTDRLRSRRAAGRPCRAHCQEPPVRLPHVRPVRALLDRHVVPDELPEGAQERPLRRRPPRRLLRGQAVSVATALTAILVTIEHPISHSAEHASKWLGEVLGFHSVRLRRLRDVEGPGALSIRRPTTARRDHRCIRDADELWNREAGRGGDSGDERRGCGRRSAMHRTTNLFEAFAIVDRLASDRPTIFVLGVAPGQLPRTSRLWPECMKIHVSASGHRRSTLYRRIFGARSPFKSSGSYFLDNR